MLTFVVQEGQIEGGNKMLWSDRRPLATLQHWTESGGITEEYDRRVAGGCLTQEPNGSGATSSTKQATCDEGR
jgi:hypothetical protein